MATKADTSVKYFSSTLTSAPAISATGLAGEAINVLTKCLVDGFNSSVVTSLVIADGVATVTVTTGHGFEMIGQDSIDSGSYSDDDATIGPVVLISGADLDDLNDEWRIDTVDTSTTFTFLCPDLNDQTATGTIYVRYAPAGWELAYEDEDNYLAAYRSSDELSTQFYFYIDDSLSTYAYDAVIRGYETMTAIDSGEDPFPTEEQYAAGLFVPRSYTTTAYNKSTAWWLVADGRCFWWLPKLDSRYYKPTLVGFGDFTDPTLSGDPAPCFIKGGSAKGSSYSASNSATGFATAQSGSQVGCYLARSYTGDTGAVTMGILSGHAVSDGPATGGFSAPSPMDGTYPIAPHQVLETGEGIRGYFPGMYHALFTMTLQDDPYYRMFEYPGDDGTKVVAFLPVIGGSGSSGAAAFDLTGPWRDD